MTKRTNSGDRNSGDRNSGDRNSGDWNSGARNSGDWNSGNWNSGARNSGDWNSGDRNSGDGNSGDRNSGSWNSGSWNSGFCNSDTPKTIRVFNKDCDTGVWRKAKKPDWMYTSPCTWVNKGNMTAQEKKDYPSYKTTGGYLRKTTLQEAWKKAFDEADEEQVRLTLSLPNYDREVFKEVFGFDPEVRAKKETCEGKTVVIDGVTYKLEKCDD